VILKFAQWLETLSLFQYLRGSSYLYPTVLSLHMVMILFFGGMILMTDLRVLGLALPGFSIASVMERLRIPKRVGLLSMLSIGFLLFGCKAEEYYGNIFFRYKAALLLLLGLHYLIFRKSVYDDPAQLDRAKVVPAQAKLAAALSLILWSLVVIAGRSIGYTPISTTPVPSAELNVGDDSLHFHNNHLEPLRAQVSRGMNYRAAP
jgi:hypothetical protein